MRSLNYNFCPTISNQDMQSHIVKPKNAAHHWNRGRTISAEGVRTAARINGLHLRKTSQDWVGSLITSPSDQADQLHQEAPSLTAYHPTSPYLEEQDGQEQSPCLA
jgi:pyruvate/2-oxoglutarate dehydrogenase complex dihydrolipoamide acyltransferase (E2) component